MTDLERAVALWRGLLQAREAAVRAAGSNQRAGLLARAVSTTVNERRAEVEGAIAMGDGANALRTVQAAWQAVHDVLRVAYTTAAESERPMLERLAEAAGAGARGMVEGVNDGLNALSGMASSAGMVLALIVGALVLMKGK